MRIVYDLIERTMAEEGWSGRIERGLAKSLDVTPRQVRYYRKKVLEQIAEGWSNLDREQETIEFLSRLLHSQAKMAKDGKWGPLVQSMSLEARVRGIENVKIEIKAELVAVDARSLETQRQAVVARLLELPAPKEKVG